MSRLSRIARFVSSQSGTDVIVVKHLAGQHDQSTHGSWATQGTTLDLIDKLISRSDTSKSLAEKLIVAKGMNKPPVVAENTKDFESKVGTVLWRGFSGSQNSFDASGQLTFMENPIATKLSMFLDSKIPYISKGKWGAGLYTSTQKTGAQDYARGNGAILQMGLKKDAKILTYYEDPSEDYNNFSKLVNEKYADYPALKSITDITTAYGILNGYDALYIQHPTDYTADGDFYSVWNSGSLIVNPDTFPENSVTKHLAGQHDQSTHGSWSKHHGGKKSDYAYPVRDAIDAVVAGNVGKVSPIDARFWLEQMADRKDNPDLTNLEIVGTRFFTRDNLGIMRNKMPQVPSDTKEQFISAMEKLGVKVTKDTVDPQKMHPIQAEISASKSGQIMKRMSKEGTGIGQDSRYIVVSKDDYVIDGHHRWAAALFLSFQDAGIRLPAIRVDMNHDDLIKATLAWNNAVGIKPIGLGQENKRQDVKKMLEFIKVVQIGIINATVVDKHLAGQHDQSTHGRRFNTTVSGETSGSILERVKEYGGLSAKLTDGSEPPDGYMVARDSSKFGTVVSATDFFDPSKGAKILGAFLIKNKQELGSGRAYLGVWHEKIKIVDGVEVAIPASEQKVHLDVTDRIVGKDKAISLGRRRNQISIWDVVNFDEIQTGGTGGQLEKGTSSHRTVGETVDGNVGRGNHGLGGKSVFGDNRSVIIRVPVGFSKHLAGQHDQSAHGSWADMKAFPTQDEIVAPINAYWDYSKKERKTSKKEIELFTAAWGATSPRGLWKSEHFDAVDSEGNPVNDGNFESTWELANGEKLPTQLDDKQREIVTWYVRDATGQSLVMNKKLRNGERATPRAGKLSKVIKSRTVKKPFQTFRGVQMRPDQVSLLKKGDSFIDRGFQSTSPNRDDAEFYVGERAFTESIPVIFRYRVATGVHALMVNSGTEEIVIDRGSRVTITNVAKAKKGFVVVDADVTHD